MSFTQYCSSKIFQYIENGFTTDKNLNKNDLAILLFKKNSRKTRIQEGYVMLNDWMDFLFPLNKVGLLIANSFLDSVNISGFSPVIDSSFTGIQGPGPSSVSDSVSQDSSHSPQPKNNSHLVAVAVSFENVLL